MKKVNFQGKKVLIVEENSAYLNVLKQYLSSLGGNIIGLDQWGRLEDVLEEEMYDLIVCDYSANNSRIVKNLMKVKERFNLTSDHFFRTRWIHDDVKDFLRAKRDGLRKNDVKKDNKNKGPILERLKTLFKEEEKLFKSKGKEVLNANTFLNEDMKAYSYGKGHDYLKIDILEIEESMFQFSSEDEIEIKDENSVVINFLVIDEEKKDIELSLNGVVKKVEESIFSEVLYDFFPSQTCLKQWKDLYKIRTDRQLTLIEQINKMKL